tara:strand:- start:337 stop:513 length:177 start_codon:yes stop_codon:yes gene_type:complete
MLKQLYQILARYRERTTSNQKIYAQTLLQIIFKNRWYLIDRKNEDERNKEISKATTAV